MLTVQWFEVSRLTVHLLFYVTAFVALLYYFSKVWKMSKNPIDVTKVEKLEHLPDIGAPISRKVSNPITIHILVYYPCWGFVRVICRICTSIDF